MIVGAWTQDVFEWHGPRFDFPPRRVIPKPLQQPHPPLWVASTSPESHEIAGQRGLGLLSFTLGVPPEDLAGRLQLYRKGLAVAKPIGKFVNQRAATFTMVHCAETDGRGAARPRATPSSGTRRRASRQIQTLGTWQEELKRDYPSYAYTKPHRADGLELPHLRLPDDDGLVHRRRSRPLHRDRQALSRRGLRPAAVHDAAPRDPGRQGDALDRAGRAAT